MVDRVGGVERGGSHLAWVEPPTLRCVADRKRDAADTRYLRLHPVPWLQRAHACRRTGKNQVARTRRYQFILESVVLNKNSILDTSESRKIG